MTLSVRRGALRRAGIRSPSHAVLGRRNVLLAAVAAVASVAGVAGCTAQPPARIGLLVGLSGEDVPNAMDARNGAILAIEQRNADGGVRGRELQLLVQDSAPHPSAAKAGAGRLLAAKVEAIVGPYTSAAVMAVLPQVNAAHVVMVSPSSSASALEGVDDHLIRMSPSTQKIAQTYATKLYQRGQRRVAVAAADDVYGVTYASVWRDTFCAAFRALGGEVVAQAGFVWNSDQAFGDVVHDLLAAQPDGLVFIGGTPAVARLVQQARKQQPGVPIAVAESADAVGLIALGGRAMEGVVLAQLFDAADTSAHYRQFQAAYLARFGRAPGFRAVATYDAIMMLADAMAQQQAGESLKQAVLRKKSYPGLQQPLVLDRFGDLSLDLHFCVARMSRFEPLV